MIKLFDFPWIFKFLLSDTQLSFHSNTCCVRRYTTCVPGYTTVSVDKQHVFVVTLDVAVGTQLK